MTKRNIIPTPVDTRHATKEEAATRAQWAKQGYVKPPHDHTTPHKASLLCSANTTNSLGYILFRDGKRVVTTDATACEFIFDDPEPFRNATIPLKTAPGFHVYYKHGACWYGVPQHFDTLAQAMPYLQRGIRCLIEYQFTK